MEKTQKIERNGSYSTRTLFRKENGDVVRVDVTFESECTVSCRYTAYSYTLSVRKFRFKKFERKYQSASLVSDKYKEYLTKQELYTAFYNHWQAVNPINMFCTYNLNGVDSDWSVERIVEPKEVRTPYVEPPKLPRNKYDGVPEYVENTVEFPGFDVGVIYRAHDMGDNSIYVNGQYVNNVLETHFKCATRAQFEKQLTTTIK